VKTCVDGEALRSAAIEVNAALVGIGPADCWRSLLFTSDAVAPRLAELVVAVFDFGHRASQTAVPQVALWRSRALCHYARVVA